MAIIHCGIVPHQSLVYLMQLISITKNPREFIHNVIIAKHVRQHLKTHHEKIKHHFSNGNFGLFKL